MIIFLGFLIVAALVIGAIGFSQMHHNNNLIESRLNQIEKEVISDYDNGPYWKN